MDDLTLNPQCCFLRLDINGELTRRFLPEIRRHYKEALQNESCIHVIIDLSQVSHLDNSGIGLLVSLYSKLTGGGRQMFLYGPSEQTIKAIEAVGLLNFFTLLHTKAEVISTTVSHNSHSIL